MKEVIDDTPQQQQRSSFPNDEKLVKVTHEINYRLF